MSPTAAPTQTVSASEIAPSNDTSSTNGASSRNGKAPSTTTARRKSAKTTGKADGKPKGNGKAKASGKTNWQIVWIAVDHIAPNPFQPRLSFDELEMQELTASVRAKGVQQPIIVRTAKPEADKADTDKASQGKASKSKAQSAKSIQSGSTSACAGVIHYELVAGERRLRACKAARKRWIPAIVRDDLTNAQAAELSLLENVQRSNISVIEEAKGYKRLMLEFRLKEERLSQKVGKSVAVIREMMKLLQLPNDVQTLLFEKKLTAAHGHALLPLAPFEKACCAVARYAVKEKLTAVSLQNTLLPNARELKSLGVLVELDFKTKFDWRDVCGKCPFKAYVHSGHSSYCLRPDEWEAKQTIALQQAEAQKAEAAQIMEQARRDNSTVVEAEHLTPGSYKDLSLSDPPAGCSLACPCYKEVREEGDPTKAHPICLNPTRYRELVQAQREAQEKERQVHYNAVWASAKDKLLNDVAGGDIRRLTVLVVLPILRSLYDENGYVQSWRQGVEEIAVELEVPLLTEFVSAEDEGEAYAALDAAMRKGLAPEKIFLLGACLLLAEEARQTIRFPREVPGLDYVLENKQALLETDDAKAEGETLLENQNSEEDAMSEEAFSDESQSEELLDEELLNEILDDERDKDELESDDLAERILSETAEDDDAAPR